MASNWLQMLLGTPTLQIARALPTGRSAMAPRQSYDMGGMAGQIGLPGPVPAAPTPADTGYSMGGMANPSALMPWLEQQAAKKPKARQAPVSSKIVGRQSNPDQMPPMPAPEPQSAPFSFISQAAAAEPAAVQQAAAPAMHAPAASASSGIMERLNEYLANAQKPADPKEAMMDNLLALAIGGLNTAAAASKPGATPFGAFAEGNAGGLQTMLGLRQARTVNKTANDREALSAMGTMANIENSTASREDNKAYRSELAADRDERLRLERERLGVQGSQFERQMSQREREAQADRDVTNRRLGLDERRVNAEAMRDEAYAASLKDGGGPGGSRPAVVQTHKYIMETGIETDPQKAWQMASRDYNDDKIASTLYAKMLDDPMFSMKPPDEQRQIVQGHLGTIRSLQGGGSAAATATPQAGGSGMPQGAKQAKDGQWYVQDPNSKSGWSRVVTTP